MTTTPPPDGKVQSETLEQIASRICRHYLDSERVSVTRFCGIEAAIVSALRNERERAAKVGDKYIADMRSVKQRTEYGEGCLNAAVYITKAIREGR